MVSKKVKIRFSIILIVVGIGLILSDVYFEYAKNKEDEKILIEFFEKIESKSEENEDNIYTDDLDKYISVLEIPKLDLLRGMVISDDKVTTVDKDISILNSSDMPNIEHGNFVIVAHSGTSKTSYFNTIYKLELGDYICVYYEDKIYTYEVTNNYTVYKTDLSPLNREKGKTVITLITCDKSDDNKRVIIKGELILEENINN